MAEPSRYKITEKGSGMLDGVLKNKLNITDQVALDDTETLLYSDAYSYFFDLLKTENIVFDISFLFSVHKYFLGTLYDWAGKVRKVNITKDDSSFAPAKYLEKSLEDFNVILLKTIPIEGNSKKEVVQKLAFIHNELNVLHPFREGNGRTIRLFLDLIASRIGYELIDWEKTSLSKYFNACKQGMVAKHRAMEKIIWNGLHKK